MGVQALPGSAGHDGRLEQWLPAIGACTQQKIHPEIYLI